MGYRDDLDALYMRATTLQRELDLAQQKLAERDAEFARTRGVPFAREDTSPGIRELRTLPSPDVVMSRLIDQLAVLSKRAELVPDDEPEPEPEPEPAAPPDPYAQKLHAARERLSRLTHEEFAMVCTIMEGLGASPLRRVKLIDKLRPILELIHTR